MPTHKFLVTVATTFAISVSFAQLPAEWKQKRDLIPYRKGAKWGYADRTGKVVIAPRWDEAHPFEQGTGLVYEGPVNHFVDRTGKVVDDQIDTNQGMEITEEVSSGSTVSSSAASGIVQNRHSHTYALQENGAKRWRVYNLKSRKAVTDYVFDSYAEFGESRSGYFLVGKDRKIGVVDSLGRLIIPHEYYTISFAPFRAMNGKPFFIISKGEMIPMLKQGLADATGKTLLPAPMISRCSRSKAQPIFS